MKLQTNLIRRGSRFYYRGRVPDDLKSHFKKSEILISLKTSDRQRADFLIAQVKNELQTQYNNIRNGKNDTVVLHSDISIKHIQSIDSASKLSLISLDSLVANWAAQSDKRPRTLMEVNTARDRLVKVAGHANALKISKADGIALKDALLNQGLSFFSIQKHISLLRAVFEVAANEDLIPENPFRSIKLVKPKGLQKPRIPFSSQDLKLIFSSPIYTANVRPDGGASEASFWLPYIALWTGMRLEEIGQLLVTDLRHENNIPYIEISADFGSGKKLKTTSSNRRIPIHRKLIELGLIEYANSISNSGSTRLFPSIKSAGSRQLTASWSQWFSRYLRQNIGIVDPRKTFHSFRHGFKEACRLYGIPKDIHDQLTGHSSSDVGDGYGGDMYPLLPLSNAINTISFEI